MSALLKSMRVAIVHYHLSPGGVSTVIRNASQALTAALIPHVILIGSSPPTNLPVQVVEGLGYLEQSANPDPKRLLSNMREAAENFLGDPPDLWHFHNHSLGKNILIPQVVNLLALHDEPLVLQLHDLAEDGRPQNYRRILNPNVLYPVSGRIHYGFLNTRDQKTFIRARLPTKNSSFFPNSISPQNPEPVPRGRAALVVYPVRAIRRKNIGELLLIAALSSPNIRFAITRAPENREALVIHEAWRRFAKDHQLPVEFAVVDRLAPDSETDSSFNSWVSQATHLITTSVAEGFGLTFLESVAFKKRLVGRNIPHVTADHPSPIGKLYERILVPSRLIDIEKLRHHLACRITEMAECYRQNFPLEFLDEVCESLHFNNHLDFGNLPETFQQRIIRLVLEGHREIHIESDGKIHDARDWLQGVWASRPRVKKLSHFYSQANYQQKLTALYKNLLTQPSSPVSYLDPQKILSAYLTPKNFRFLQ